MKTATVMVVRPRKDGDPTQHTYSWGQQAMQLAQDLGYNVIDIQKENVNYTFVTDAIRKYNPKLFAAFSHGCPNSLIGQSECYLTRKFDALELMQMIEESPEKRDTVRKMLNPLGDISCPGICKLDVDICNPICSNNTNINELKGTIVYTTACFSAKQLGLCAIKYGIPAYLGADDLYMFPVDTLNSQDMFGNIQLEGYRTILEGKTIGEAEQNMIKLEDSYIRKYKKVKYISLTMLWNKVHRKLIGNENAMIY